MIKITDELKARVTSAEGIVDHVYLDSLGKATIGIGHLIKPHEKERFPEGKKISREEIDELFDLDINRAAAGADLLIEEKVGHDLPTHIEHVIVEMVFQLGTQGVRNFSKMWKNMRVKKWKEAAEEMKDSRWHKQTTNRCEHLAEIVANT
jgi:GH24 family phage-related lysozyme (muramidase)|tara:strand:+ start:118 stop:567 length:450 start_codon:yes stop_codon:yes gene_type:complete